MAQGGLDDAASASALVPGSGRRRLERRGVLAVPILLAGGAMKILLVEDNTRLSQVIQQGLQEEGIDVVHVIEAAAALDRVDRADLDLLVLDLGLPDRDGLEVLQELRRAQQHVPVLILTARDAVETRVQALELGADDFLIKPFEFAELVARIRALSRRASGPRWWPQDGGAVVLDDGHVVHCAGRQVALSPREYALLSYLLRRRGEVVPRGDILREVFKCASDPGTNTLDVHLAHLRRKLAGMAVCVETVRGAGIRLKVDAA
ncbi:response regulator transcription factor [Nannocystis sp. SCPEA4]|uniref:response regulator transcription factor n=1 Tax=Nannocystis sp. SCPEA4 TaxID=2996787 RepID=UPI00226EF735|nr:response regulator transcription factor [Nannocystis sp. SCPEA4]MCY1061522.1 response regulator transcription factor [Nannocystis sp. SCPEA4]